MLTSFPPAEDGVFDGGLLYDGCGYRQPSDIVAYSHALNRLGIIQQKTGYFVAQFLSKRTLPHFSLPIWDEIRTQVICASLAEARALTDDFAAGDTPAA